MFFIFFHYWDTPLLSHASFVPSHLKTTPFLDTSKKSTPTYKLRIFASFLDTPIFTPPTYKPNLLPHFWTHLFWPLPHVNNAFYLIFRHPSLWSLPLVNHAFYSIFGTQPLWTLPLINPTLFGHTYIISFKVNSFIVLISMPRPFLSLPLARHTF